MRAFSSLTRAFSSSAAPTAVPSTPRPVSDRFAGSTERSTDALPFSPTRSKWIPIVSTTSTPDSSKPTIPAVCGIDNVSALSSASAVVSNMKLLSAEAVLPAESVTVTVTVRSPSERPLTSMSPTVNPSASLWLTTASTYPVPSLTLTATATMSSSIPLRATVTSPDSRRLVRMSGELTSTPSGTPSNSAELSNS